MLGTAPPGAVTSRAPWSEYPSGSRTSGPVDDTGLVEQLQRVARLHDGRVLDDDEFAAAETRLLA